VTRQRTCEEDHLGHLEPMVAAAERELTAAGVTQKPQVVVADAGY
jgi:hypothetical protein